MTPTHQDGGEMKACPSPFHGPEKWALQIYTQREATFFCAYVHCGCGLDGPSCDTEAEAIAAWNHRPIPQDHGDSPTDAPAGWLTREEVNARLEYWRHATHECTHPETPCQWCWEEQNETKLCLMALAALKTQDHGEKAQDRPELWTDNNTRFNLEPTAASHIRALQAYILRLEALPTTDRQKEKQR